MAETSPIRYSFGGDEHLFAEVSDSMSLEAFFKGMAVTRAVAPGAGRRTGCLPGQRIVPDSLRP